MEFQAKALLQQHDQSLNVRCIIIREVTDVIQLKYESFYFLGKLRNGRFCVDGGHWHVVNGLHAALVHVDSYF